jgi:hypothetical protein
MMAAAAWECRNTMPRGTEQTSVRPRGSERSESQIETEGSVESARPRKWGRKERVHRAEIDYAAGTR